MPRKRATAEVVADALRQSSGTVSDLANEGGVSRNTLHTWAQGTRSPSPENKDRLVGALRDRSEALSLLAVELASD